MVWKWLIWYSACPWHCKPEALPWGWCDHHPMLTQFYWIFLFLQALHKQWLLQEPYHDYREERAVNEEAKGTFYSFWLSGSKKGQLTSQGTLQPWAWQHLPSYLHNWDPLTLPAKSTHPRFLTPNWDHTEDEINNSINSFANDIII